MSRQITSNIITILRNQDCKNDIQSKLRSLRHTPTQKDGIHSIELESMIFQVIDKELLSDYVYLFPCVFQGSNKSVTQQIVANLRQENKIEYPEVGSFIKTKNMYFDLDRCLLIVKDYENLGQDSKIQIKKDLKKVNWTPQTIKQLVTKDRTHKGPYIMLDSFTNESKLHKNEDKKTLFQTPKIQFLTGKHIFNFLTNSNQSSINLNVQKITTRNLQNQQKSQRIQEEKER